MIRHEYEAYNDFESDFDSAIAVLSTIQTAIIADHNDHVLSNAVWGVERLLASAKASLEGGRAWGKPQESTWIDDE